MELTIARINETDYSVLAPTVLADGSRRFDGCCRLNGGVLRSHEQRGDVRTGGLIRVSLGPSKLAIVQALAIGQSVTFTY
jgi:hypothetical protein